MEIINEEAKIIDYLHARKHDEIKKCLFRLESDLKYLSILANGAPIDKTEDRKIMDFLRIHYDNLRNLSLPA